ncbi:hypothetical protein J3R30DRAFT_3427067 [Lentinula aciculospora]|uniref:CBD9-like protein n=1 Tax=Lentinula aciculospora TaxID=153920 RepID=A0A9W9AUI8_9AGAR|nr:hypothetical protein J3R30DRAFT_3427067 [Lentinula aciculospora]
MVSTLLPGILILLMFSFAVGRDLTRGATPPTGDYACSNYMCINATLTGDMVEYTLSSTGKRNPGWMAVGFGTQMSNNPMVILWSNSDGSITLSQRVARSWVMPEVVPDPPRIATLSSDLSTASADKHTFNIPWDNSVKTNLIWAFGTQNPGSSAVDAPFQFHLDAGYAHFDLSKPLSASSKSDSSEVSSAPSNVAPASNPISPSSLTSTSTLPLNAHQRMAVAHAVFCTAGFLVFLPVGALVSRWVRTFTSAWYTAHWILQFVVAGPSIIIGLAFGVQTVNNGRIVEHPNDEHKKWGIILFALYICQCALGALVHWVKPKNSTGRPLQNYLHAGFGLILIGLGFYQVHSGYKKEWPETVGRADLMRDADLIWYIWIVVVLALYSAGLILLPKQLRQEAELRSMKEVATKEEQSSLLAESQPEEIGMHKIYRDRREYLIPV